MRKLTPKQERFAEEYLLDLNASQAAVRAGYTGDPNTIGPRLLANVGVRSHIEGAMKRRAQRTEITQDRVLQELARIAFFDIRRLYNNDGTMKKPTDLDDDTAAALVGIDIQETTVPGEDGSAVIVTRKAKVIERTGALTLAMRHLGMLNDKLQHSGEIGLRTLATKMRERAQKPKK